MSFLSRYYDAYGVKQHFILKKSMKRLFSKTKTQRKTSYSSLVVGILRITANMNSGLNASSGLWFNLSGQSHWTIRLDTSGLRAIWEFDMDQI